MGEERKSPEQMGGERVSHWWLLGDVPLIERKGLAKTKN